MTQFVIVVLAPNETLSTLAENFIQHILLKSSICHLVILDDDIPFKGVLSTMCKTLNIYYNILAKRNHVGLLVEKLYIFLVITIAVDDRGTNDIFVTASVAVGYA